ncbi:choice-of-anchor D domain-containing protein [Algibacter amylolyticus]|uniref:Choice-of-anchor D domain-containing protein n=1 Tax=Algibacter amylolyticus TaxID=1608400 RepID=A0A5M7ATM5_9FLAO|nr:LamG-like jellyroll fold domain-containing protein [Algibacter amylolyticus]KAA5820903.1 choice-of-anchor D domain-containing protein [Algibacter amylolyticus]MBB5269852.1 hypothetical protein [Algibacter amylolyticus]TSJ71978.1 choice-of-anchor D domain-containing protein [Algibacter amylolyticus]
MEKKYALSPKLVFVLVLLFLIGFNGFSQVEIASQRFHNGSPDYPYTVADKDGVFAPPSQTISTHVGSDNWDYTATTSDGIIRVVNSSVTNPASDFYCLELKNYWEDAPSLEFKERDLSNYVNVTFSIAYQSLGDPENNEDLILNYSYLDGGTWVDNTVVLVEGNSSSFLGVPYDITLFNYSILVTNPYQVSIPDSATKFRATISATFKNGANGSDNYYIDDVILSGEATTIAPVATCKGDFAIELDAFGNASITSADIDDGSTVSVGTKSLSIDKSSFTCNDLGPNLITLTVNDGTQSSTCTTTVTVNSYTGAMVTPTIPDTTTYCSFTATPPEDISYKCNTVSPTTTDPISFDTPGSYSITWRYQDSVSGDSETAIQNITLNNIAAPTGIAVTNIGADTATISWNAQIGVESYEIQYKKNNLVNWETVTTTNNTINITALNQLTLYDVRVGSVCGESTVYSGITNFTTAGHDYCDTNVDNTSTRVYVRTVRVGTINNTEGRQAGGYDDNTHLSTVLYKNESHTFNFSFRNSNYYNIGHAVWIDFNGDGDFEDANELVWNNNGNLDNAGTYQYHSPSILIPSFAVTGPTRMRVAVRQNGAPDGTCDDDSWGDSRGEFEDYTLNLQIRPDAPQEIDVTGNDNLIIDDAGVTDISEENNTDYGKYDVFEVPMVKTYRITNNGADPLTLTGSPLIQFTSNTGDFTLTQPSVSVLAIGESTTFTVTFNPSTVGVKNATIQILNDDLDASDTEDNYTFYIQGQGVKSFQDTDGDGVPDNIDGDDDNDGLLDSTEDNACKSYAYSNQVETVFLNETFGAGYNRITIEEASSGSSTTYCYEDGSGACGGSTSVNDGSYTLYYQTSNGDGVNQTPIGDVAEWADRDWYVGLDHTPDSIDGAEPGRMLIVNADYDPGIFYQATITGVTPGVEVIYGFSVINLIRTDHPRIGDMKKPQVSIAVYDPNGVLIAIESSGLIEATDASNPAGDWINLETSFTTTSSQFTIQLINDQEGGGGNDLAIDDIYVKQLLCDQDGDGVADSVDLDNDNDGIPNVVELGLADPDKDATLLGSGWVDNNANGVHDSYEGGAPIIDTDGDGIPDYVDADSDNDGIFDAVEYDGLGDIDVDGDGKGDGSDIDSFLIDDEADGDGLLAIIDGNDSDSDGVDHGSAGYTTPLDSDSDGIPDYLEIDSNNDGVFDIEETIYVDYDTNNDGRIDGSADVDKDGILDSFDTNSTVFGSPRKLDESYTLYFDGRNDYISENLPVIDSWSSSTLMAWIKIAPGASGKRRIVGQDNFYLAVNADGTAIATAGGVSANSTTVLPINIWVHVAASFNNVDGNFVLYVNGEEESIETAGTIPAAVSDFTVGRKPGVLGEENVLTSEYFKGEIDEVRLFNAGLSEDEIQKMVYQELDDTNGFETGKIIPINISAITGSSLQRYYKMDKFDADITSEKKGISTGAKLYNIKNVYFQTAPLPFVTTTSGVWTDKSSWLHGDVWDIDEIEKNKDWSVVKIEHDITANQDVKTLGLLIDSNKTLKIEGDHLVKNSWYFQLNGVLDLEDDSQLIQTETSNLITSANGRILRRQEGEANAFRYNYWASPVGVTGVTNLSDNNAATHNTNNTSFSLGMLNDEAGNNVTFTSDYTANGNISTYWMYTFKNGITYWDWERISPTAEISPGVGFTKKGSGTAGANQQYIFEGKPNNGTILIDVIDSGGAGSEANVSKTSYLLGNPYASALDVYQFLEDNEGVIDGYLQLWQQWSGNSHNLSEYNGGYAQVNKLGAIRAFQFKGTSGKNTGSQDGTLLPSRYLPVGQGFLAEIVADGVVEFNNGQRVFVKESDADGSGENGSVFLKSENTKASKTQTSNTNETANAIKKIRLEFSSVTGPETRRELLLGFSDFTTDGFDYGYDAKYTEVNNNDLNLNLEGQNMTMQAYSQITSDKVVALNFVSSGDNTFEIKISDLINMDDSQVIYLRDNLTGTYFDLTQDVAYSFSSAPGVFNKRFEIVFQSEQEALSTEESVISENYMYYQNASNTFFIKKLHTDVSKLSLVNMRGQVILELDNVTKSRLENGLQFNNMATGAYVVYLRTDTNEVLTKKIIVK